MSESKNYQRVNVPMDAVEDAVRAVEQARSTWQAIEARRAELPESEYLAREAGGEAGVERMRKALAAMDAERNEAAAAAVAKVRAARGAFEANVSAQVTPSAEQLAVSASVVELFDRGLILDAEQLAATIETNPSPAIRVLAERYAEQRGWNDAKAYTYVSDAETVRSFAAYWFSTCEAGAWRPLGPSAMQVCAEGEVERLLSNYGLA